MGYRRYYWRNQPSQRTILTNFTKGLDRDVEEFFLQMSGAALEPIWKAYGTEYGSGPLQYAKRTHASWKHGHVKMSGTIAKRLLNLVPLALSPEERFTLIRKARDRFMPKMRRRVRCAASDWRESLTEAINDVISISTSFKIPEEISKHVVWLAGGNAEAAQKLLAAAEKQEAAMRIGYLKAEFQRIEAFMTAANKLNKVQHTITLPQGSIAVTIHRKRDLRFKIASWFD